MPLLQVDKISKKFGKNRIFEDVSFSVQKGDVVVILGPSGTGKSTLLRCINLLHPPDEGFIYLDDQEITAAHKDIHLVRQKIGMVFQHFALFNHLTAWDNVALGLRKVRKLPKDQAYEKALAELDRVGLVDHKEKYPAELSGGQKQRVGIARALAMDPVLMLFDEPTSALDPELIGEVLNVMRKLASEGMTMICVTHELGFAKNVANQIMFMEGGNILETAPPQEFFSHPKSERTKDFLSKITDLH